jgi:hypothetical protein
MSNCATPGLHLRFSGDASRATDAALLSLRCGLRILEQGDSGDALGTFVATPTEPIPWPQLLAIVEAMAYTDLRHAPLAGASA